MYRTVGIVIKPLLMTVQYTKMDIFSEPETYVSQKIFHFNIIVREIIGGCKYFCRPRTVIAVTKYAITYDAFSIGNFIRNKHTHTYTTDISIHIQSFI